MKPFVNEPVLELRRASVRERLPAALAATDARLPLRVPVLVGDDRRDGDELGSTDPGEPDRLVAAAARATADDVDAAVRVAASGFAEWSVRPARERAQVMVDAAERLRARRIELAALAVRECAKPWPEADAEVCEAIDFLEYYARAAVQLDRGPDLLQAPGERNELHYVPRGVVAVISPWNFPLAIPLGMTAAALVTGNAAILKPAEQSPGCALELVEALHDAGVPRAALALVPGEGDVGARLVRHPLVHTVAFTGSAAVGLEIASAAAQVDDGQLHLKRVIAEMGGKNCVIIDADADLDESLPAIVASAFAYAGQKCSAASRVLAHEAISDHLLERLAGAVDTLSVGQAETLGTDVPPVIERAARERIAGYVEQARRDGRVVARGEEPLSQGWFCPPTVVADLAADSPVLEQEIFGPLLSVEPVRDVDAACTLVEGLPFALTAGLFARNPATVEHVSRRLPVGNLYVNRATTGAMVGRQPFGGNRLSGTGTKAGGPDYLMSFVEPRTVTENVVRHGIAPELG